MHETLTVRREGPFPAGGPVLQLPSTGPEPITAETALAAVLGYARGRRPLHFRSPNEREGRWVQVLAFGYERFDGRPVPVGTFVDDDVLVAEGLHGRLDPAGWADLRRALDDVRPLADELVALAGGRALDELPDEEFSVLGEPGTVGAALRGLGELPGVQPRYVAAALHHRHPGLVPLTDRSTRLALLPHVREGDSGLAAVVHRELRANPTGFGWLQSSLQDVGIRLSRLRLHDVLLWLSATLRFTHAVTLGRRLAEQPVG